MRRYEVAWCRGSPRARVRPLSPTHAVLPLCLRADALTGTLGTVAGIEGFVVQVPSPHIDLRDDLLDRHGIRLYLKRDDLIHPDIPGNKWRKLKYNITADQKQKATTLLTFDGAYSNHIRATAAAGYHFGFHAINVIRDEEHHPLNYSLSYAVEMGRRLSYLGSESVVRC